MRKDIIGLLQNTINEVVESYKRQKIVLDLWPSESKSSKEKDDCSQIVKFQINKAESIKSPQSEKDIKSRITNMINQASNLQDSIATILDDNESQLNENTKTAIDMIGTGVDRFKKTFEIKANKYCKGVLDDNDTRFEKKKDLFYEFVQNNYKILFDDIVSAIYRGVKMTDNSIYDIVLTEINDFLKSTGIYTKQVSIGEKMNFEYCEYADEQSSRETEKYDLDDCIYEIRQYPYFIDDGVLVSSGKVCTWRLVK